MALNFRIKHSEFVDLDLDDIYNYIAIQLRNPEAAASQIQRIVSAIEKLSSYPRLYKIRRKDSQGREFRSFPVDNYTVIYRLDESDNIVNILHVFYGKRDIDTLIDTEQQ